MANHIRCEDLIELHPLDEIGSNINQILRRKPEVIRTDKGVTHTRSVRVGEISVFFARFTGPDRDTFTVGLDSVENDEYTPLSDDFVWDIHNPQASEKDVLDSVEKLGALVRRLRQERA